MKASVYILRMTIVCVAMMVSGLVNGQAVGTTAPDFTLSTDIGTEFTLSSQRGRIVFIFFFGYACPHCLENGNNTETGVYNLYKEDSDFVAIGVDTWNGTEAGVASYKSSTGLTYPLCYDGSDLESLYSTTYDRMVVVDREGIIQYKSTANATSNVVQEASSMINSLLNATAVEEVRRSNDISLSIYPNPASDQIYIKPSVKSEGKATILIRNTNGQIVATKQIRRRSGAETVRMPVGSLVPGIYVLQYQSDSIEKSVKLVVGRN